jgi:hypothetical protein
MFTRHAQGQVPATEVLFRGLPGQIEVPPGHSNTVPKPGAEAWERRQGERLAGLG